MDQIVAILTEFSKVIGLPPELFGVSLAVAILLRLARGMDPSFGPSKTYYSALVIGAVCGAWRAWRVGIDGAPTAGLAVAASTLLLQFALQKLAGKVSWLPNDNEWTGQARGETPTKGAGDASDSHGGAGGSGGGDVAQPPQ